MIINWSRLYVLYVVIRTRLLFQPIQGAQRVQGGTPIIYQPHGQAPLPQQTYYPPLVQFSQGGQPIYNTAQVPSHYHVPPPSIQQQPQQHATLQPQQLQQPQHQPGGQQPRMTAHMPPNLAAGSSGLPPQSQQQMAVTIPPVTVAANSGPVSLPPNLMGSGYHQTIPHQSHRFTSGPPHPNIHPMPHQVVTEPSQAGPAATQVPQQTAPKRHRSKAITIVDPDTGKSIFEGNDVSEGSSESTSVASTDPPSAVTAKLDEVPVNSTQDQPVSSYSLTLTIMY